ncbi:hypothetical protein DL96DRAFT_872200 [Flagelloscypha sp. PMI_526]|nr:hypothetical protein DL96DRAFT_872200 [Flagelloscypha sp. PMI_526]
MNSVDSDSDLETGPDDPVLLEQLRSRYIPSHYPGSDLSKTLHNAQVFIEALDAQLGFYNNEINIVQQLRRRAYAKYKHQASLAAPIRSLPSEILREVFTLVCGPEAIPLCPSSAFQKFDSYYRRAEEPEIFPLFKGVTLAHVCYHWRTLVLYDCPELWNSVYFILSFNEEWKTRDIEAAYSILEWSGSSFLSVKIEVWSVGDFPDYPDISLIHDSSVHAIFQLLVAQQQRWKTLSLVVPDVLDFFALASHTVTSVATPGWPKVDRILRTNALLDFPNLTRLSLQGTDPPQVWRLWSQITDLSMELSPDGCAFFHETKLPKLQTLSLTLVDVYRPQIIIPTLPTLRSLSIKFSQSSQVYSFPLKAPMIVQLSLELPILHGCLEGRELPDFPCLRSFQILVTSSVAWVIVTKQFLEDLRYLLRGMDLLTSLDITFSDYWSVSLNWYSSDLLAWLLSGTVLSKDGHESIIAPRLISLTLSLPVHLIRVTNEVVVALETRWKLGHFCSLDLRHVKNVENRSPAFLSYMEDDVEEKLERLQMDGCGVLVNGEAYELLGSEDGFEAWAMKKS